LSRPGNSKSQLKVNKALLALLNLFSVFFLPAITGFFNFLENPKISPKSQKLKTESKIEFQNVNNDVTVVFVLKERKEREVFFYCVLRMRSPILMTSCTFEFLLAKLKGVENFVLARLSVY
jgi:hypothetical protein